MKDERALTTRCDLLVVAAFEPELAGLEAGLQLHMQRLWGERVGVVVCAVPVGVGLVEAAFGTASRLGVCRAGAVILVGTCGAYPESGLSIGDVVVARSTLLVAPAVVEGRAALPDVMPSRVNASEAITADLASLGAQIVDVATTLAVTTDDILAAELAKCGAVEHLEAFAVASACMKENVPFAAVLGVANRVGSRGRSEWREHHAAAGRAAVSYVTRWIEAGALGA
jgi:futalosine hydrolase